MMNKYHNTKIYCKEADVFFDSKKEHDHYHKLKLLERTKAISSLNLQPVFELQPNFKKNGKTYQKITYKADFTYFDNRLNKVIVEDVKGFKTDIYKLKKKMFEYKYSDLELREI